MAQPNIPEKIKIKSFLIEPYERHIKLSPQKTYSIMIELYTKHQMEIRGHSFALDFDFETGNKTPLLSLIIDESYGFLEAREIKTITIFQKYKSQNFPIVSIPNINREMKPYLTLRQMWSILLAYFMNEGKKSEAAKKQKKK